jgi:hypothetical protein
MNKSESIDHDRLFKELIETFFTEFVALFFPDAYQEIDLTHLNFLQQEVFTDVTAGEKHVVDLLVETMLRDENGLILIHGKPSLIFSKTLLSGCLFISPDYIRSSAGRFYRLWFSVTTVIMMNRTIFK